MFSINKNIFDFHVRQQRKTKQNKQQKPLKASRKLNKLRKIGLRPQWEIVTYLLIYLGFIFPLLLRRTEGSMENVLMLPVFYQLKPNWDSLSVIRIATFLNYSLLIKKQTACSYSVLFPFIECSSLGMQTFSVNCTHLY